MTLISYICRGNFEGCNVATRTIMYTGEFENFYSGLKPRVRENVDYGMDIIASIKVVSSKLIKKLTNSALYELRISVDNEYRIIMFAVDNPYFVSASRVVLLSGFVKKSTKDYIREIHKAERILNTIGL